MGVPLHCYTYAGRGQILENLGKIDPKHQKQNDAPYYLKMVVDGADKPLNWALSL